MTCPRLICMFACFALAATGSAQTTTTAPAYLNEYETIGTRLRAGFTPTKASPVFGERLAVTFSVTNLGPGEFTFDFGGDNRGKGRHNRFKIVAVDEAGVELPDPRANAGEFGGMSFRRALKPGETFENRIDLGAFRTFDKPGRYRLACSFAFDPPYTQVETPRPTVETAFELVVLERTPQRVAAVLDDLAARARAAEQADARAELLRTLVEFGRDDDDDDAAAAAGAAAAARLVAMTTADAPAALRAAAFEALVKLPGDAVLAPVLAGLKDPDDAVRAGAASALGVAREEHQDRAAEALLAAFPGERPAVAAAVLVALGRTKSPRALPLLAQSLRDRTPELRYAAVDGLTDNGTPDAVAVLVRHVTTTDDLPTRYRIARAIAERLRQPMAVEWVVPVVLDRSQGDGWYDAIRLLRMYGGARAVPALLGCVDYAVPWSTRNWWILEAVKICPGAPPFEYTYDPNREGTPEEIAQNLDTLAKLRPLATALPAAAAAAAGGAPRVTEVPLLRTDPPIDFVPRITPDGDASHKVDCGFFHMTMQRNGAQYSYEPTEPWQPLYRLHRNLADLIAKPDQRDAALRITPGQRTRLAALRLPPTSFRPPDAWHTLRWRWRESPPGPPGERAEQDFRNAVQSAVQDHHRAVAEFVDEARKILSDDQIAELQK